MLVISIPCNILNPQFFKATFFEAYYSPGPLVGSNKTQLGRDIAVLPVCGLSSSPELALLAANLFRLGRAPPKFQVPQLELEGFDPPFRLLPLRHAPVLLPQRVIHSLHQAQ